MKIKVKSHNGTEVEIEDNTEQVIRFYHKTVIEILESITKEIKEIESTNTK